MKNLQLWTVTLLLLSFLFLPIGIASDIPFADEPFDVNNIPEPVPPPSAVVDFFDLSDTNSDRLYCISSVEQIWE